MSPLQLILAKPRQLGTELTLCRMPIPQPGPSRQERCCVLNCEPTLLQVLYF